MQLTVRARFALLALCPLVFLGAGCRVAATPGAGPSDDGAPGKTASNDSDDDATSGRGGTSSKASTGGTNGATSNTSEGSGGTTRKANGAPPLADGAAAVGTLPDDSATGSANGSAAGGTSPDGSAAASGVGNGGVAATGDDSLPPGQSSPSGSGCDAQTVSFDEIRAGAVRSDVEVRVDATATSQKFLLSHAHSGSCLFGAFVGLDADAEGPRGLLVVSYGDDAADGDACPPGTDAIPDDLSPGDGVRTVGYLGSYAPSGCSATPSAQLMVNSACPLGRSERRAAPEPFALTLDDADALARGTDSARVRRFAGGLVRLENVSARRADDGTGSVGPYGVITLNETALELHNDLEYGNLTLGGPGDVQKSLVFAYPTDFASVVGLVYLDYCTWSLTPRSRCDDLVPASANCR